MDISNPSAMGSSPSPKSQSQLLFNLRILWFALFVTMVIYGVVLFPLVSQNRSLSETGMRSPITTFGEASKTPEFGPFFFVSVFLVILSRWLPKRIFSQLVTSRKPQTDAQWFSCYFPGFILGMVFLETVGLLGFVHAFLYSFFPSFLLFAFVAASNMLIRFPRWEQIKASDL